MHVVAFLYLLYILCPHIFLVCLLGSLLGASFKAGDIFLMNRSRVETRSLVDVDLEIGY